MSWIQTTLGEYYDVRDGTHDSPKYVKEGFPLVTSKNLKDGKIDLTKVKFISEKDYQDINRRSGVAIGDVLMAMIGTIGNPVEIVESPEFAIKNVALFKTNDQQCPAYLKYFLSHPMTVARMINDAKGTTQKFVGLGYLRKFPITIPPLSEQQRIVAKLDAAFAEIEKMIKSNEENCENINALGRNYIDKLFSSVVGEKTKLEKVTSTLTCGVAKRPKYVERGIPFLSARNVKNGEMKWENYKFVDKETHLKLTKYNKPELGDILYSRVGSFGDAAIVDKHLEFSIFVSLTLIKPKEELNNEYLCHYLNSSFIKKLASSSITGTGVGNLNVSAVRKFPIVLIPIAQQIAAVKKINIFLAILKKLLSINSTKLENILKLKEVILVNELKVQGK